MKPSKFNVAIPLEDSNSGGENLVLLYNTFSDSRVVVNREVMEFMDQAGERTKFTAQEKEVLDPLMELGFLLDQDVNEDLELEYWFQKFKFDTSEMGVTLLTTYACNMDCVYCYEKGVVSSKQMREETWRRAVLWMIRKMEDARPKTLRLTFFGGEPLLNPGAVREVSEELSYAARKRGVELEIWIVTNGVLLTRELVEFLLPFGLRNIKVTLDGDKGTHDLLRPARGGDGTFDRILENLRRIRGLVPITIGGNFYSHSKDSIPALLDRLRDAGFTAADIEAVRFKPVLSGVGEVGGKCAVGGFSEAEAKDFLWIREEVQKRGFPAPNDLVLGPCDATREYYYVIDPVGKIYKCPGFVGREEMAIGDLHDEKFIHRNVQFMTVDLWKKCRGCPFIPICGGGCRVNSQAQCGDFRQASCEQLYFIQVGMEVLKKEESRVAVG
ncbi:MAG: SPASM domain-containing protein [Nitrospirae bacterium]|nr:SPASM domain-containing protein [Nitrospirota bacterium]